MRKSLNSVLTTAKIDEAAAAAEDGDEEDSKTGERKYPLFSPTLQGRPTQNRLHGFFLEYIEFYVF